MRAPTTSPLKRLLPIILGVGSMMTGCSLAAAQPSGEVVNSETKMKESKTKISQEIQFLREEEKLARDVYLTLHKRWNLQIFSNISQAEQRHMDRMGMIIEQRGLVDPIKSDDIGVFTNKKLDALYKTLVKRGSQSEVDALLVGATIEDLDLRDIREMNKRADGEELQDALAKLECGSRNHLRAFTRQLKSRGVTYTPKYLSQREVDTIVAGSHERCGRMGRQGAGRGQGHALGQGRGQGHSNDQAMGQRRGHGNSHAKGQGHGRGKNHAKGQSHGRDKNHAKGQSHGRGKRNGHGNGHSNDPEQDHSCRE